MLTEQEKEELEERVQFIRSLAGNSVIQQKIDESLNRIRFLSAKASAEELDTVKVQVIPVENNEDVLEYLRNPILIDIPRTFLKLEDTHDPLRK